MGGTNLVPDSDSLLSALARGVTIDDTPGNMYSSVRIPDGEMLPAKDVNDPENFFSKRRSRLRKITRLFCAQRYLVGGITIVHQMLLTTVLIAVVCAAYLQGQRQNQSRLAVQGFVPPVPNSPSPVVFTESLDWTGNTTRASHHWNVWLKNFDTHTISISLEDVEKFGYEAGLPDTKRSQRFGISMFHQLHCLAMIREFAYTPESVRMKGGRPMDHDGVLFSSGHTDHCFNYLRQAILCAADSTVEWARYNDKGEMQGIQGWGIAHEQCRDHGALESFAKDHNVFHTHE